MNADQTSRLIAYHDSMCSPNCGEDISTYPIPPDDWEAPMPAIEEHGCAHCFAAVYHSTTEEKRRGVCNDCYLRALEHARQEWRAFEDRHADVLDQD